ncbi:MAG: hypothetical protein KGI38_12185 [Thaumarchaeota archaeon]|nr:hypothetical protein [Nitrososphaerota archaeon]
MITARLAEARALFRADPERWGQWLIARTTASKKKGNKIETQAQTSLVARGVPFLANKVVEGICEADVVLTDFKIAVFCDGCYWHRSVRQEAPQSQKPTEAEEEAYTR